MSDPVQPIDPKDEEIGEEDKLLAVLAYVPFLCLIPFVRPDRSVFVTRHVQIGLMLFVAEIFAVILRYLPVVWDVVIFVCVLLALVGIFHVVRGRTFTLPVISDWLRKQG
ncbi:MAG: hypothetical protein PHI18_07165 [bacterium]|nr:hypothetical protein [bacterium]